MIRHYFSGYDTYQFEYVQFVRTIDWTPETSVITYNAHNVEYNYLEITK